MGPARSTVRLISDVSDDVSAFLEGDSGVKFFGEFDGQEFVIVIISFHGPEGVYDGSHHHFDLMFGHFVESGVLFGLPGSGGVGINEVDYEGVVDGGMVHFHVPAEVKGVAGGGLVVDEGLELGDDRSHLGEELDDLVDSVHIVLFDGFEGLLAEGTDEVTLGVEIMHFGVGEHQ